MVFLKVKWLTDHNAIDGLHMAVPAVKAVPGISVSGRCDFNCSHTFGYLWYFVQLSEQVWPKKERKEFGKPMTA